MEHDVEDQAGVVLMSDSKMGILLAMGMLYAV